MPTPPPTPIEAFLAPLAKLALKQPAIEGLVFWDDGGWPDRPAEALESEEIAFYAEGLLLDGFHMVWQVVAEDTAPVRPDHVRLFFWQEDAGPVPLPAAPWHLTASATWGGREMTEPVFITLQQDCAAEGVILFTLSIIEAAATLTRRIHTSHPREYPLGGIKPMARDARYEACIIARAPFVANTAAEFAAFFPDHGLITSMGLGSCVNIPVMGRAGDVVGTVNLLAGPGHFTPSRLRACEAIVARHHAALSEAMQRARLLPRLEG